MQDLQGDQRERAAGRRHQGPAQGAPREGHCEERAHGEAPQERGKAEQREHFRQDAERESRAGDAGREPVVAHQHAEHEVIGRAGSPMDGADAEQEQQPRVAQERRGIAPVRAGDSRGGFLPLRQPRKALGHGGEGGDAAEIGEGHGGVRRAIAPRGEEEAQSLGRQHEADRSPQAGASVAVAALALHRLHRGGVDERHDGAGEEGREHEEQAHLRGRAREGQSGEGEEHARGAERERARPCAQPIREGAPDQRGRRSHRLLREGHPADLARRRIPALSDRERSS